MAVRNIRVDPQHLKGLATTQDAAANDFDSAINKTAGIGTEVWTTHGLYVFLSNMELDKAESLRKSAGEALQKLSAGLAGNLRTAVKAYEGADDHAKDNIDKQVRDR